jgi:hypothetical protein
VSLKRDFLAHITQSSPPVLPSPVTPNHIEWLIEWAKYDAREEVQTAAVQGLVLLSYPSETVPGLQVAILKEGLLDTLVRKAAQGLVTVHHEVPFTDLRLGDVLGKGASASVYKGVWQGREVALKVFDPEHISFMLEDFRKEVALLCMLQHPHLVRGFAACTRGPRLAIVMEYLPNGSLRDFLRHAPDSYDLTTCVRLARDIADGTHHPPALSSSAQAWPCWRERA